MRILTREKIVACLILVGSGILYLATLAYPVKERLFPQVLIYILGFLAVVMFIKYYLKKAEDPKQKTSLVGYRPTYFAGGVVFYLCVEPYLGFELATGLFLMTSMWLMGYRRWTVFPISIITVTFISYVFRRLLYVPLHLGFFESFIYR
jgi:cell division protein FtsW (lipid II flippase)